MFDTHMKMSRTGETMCEKVLDPNNFNATIEYTGLNEKQIRYVNDVWMKLNREMRDMR